MKKYRGVIPGILVVISLSTVFAGGHKLPDPSVPIAKISWLKDTARQTNQVWRTKYDVSMPKREYHARIIAYAGKWTRHNYGGHGGLGNNCGWRYADGPLVPKIPADQIGYFISDKYDIDGDGNKKDDFVYTLPHSMQVPLSIPDWPAANVFPERLSSTFYGGTTFYCGNNSPDKTINFSSEMGINADHSCFFDGRAEDHPINGQRHKKIVGSFLKHYVTMIWKKEDFLNTGGGKFRVSFDDTSRLATFCTRGYWYGWNDVRFIVQNKNKFYISEIVEPVPDYAFKKAGPNRKSGYLPVCYPTKTKWAKYNPKNHQIDFDPDTKFESVKFDDVQAAGWYLAKTDNSGDQTHCKWYGFEADAIIHAPSEPSANIEMTALKGSGVPDFYMSTCEVPYSLWRDIYRFGDSPWNILEARYVYDKSGSMGSMAYGKRDHQHDEPVTDLTFYDTLALCNTLSEMEGKTPCYYLDSDFKTIFRNQHIQSRIDYNGKSSYEVRNFEQPTEHPQPEPKIYVNWAANGHRLPTVAEWKAAAGSQGSEVRSQESAKGTHPVGTTPANKKGLYDMAGNVWELCWTFGDVYDPETNLTVSALGGDFLSGGSISPYGDTPYSGSGNLGLRLVCREAGSKKPAMGKAGKTPAWQFKKGEAFGKKAAKSVSKPVMDMVKIPGGEYKRHDKKIVKIAPFEMCKFSTTYDRWKTVRQWGEANGYDFDHNGDMGSMYWFDFTHSPDEPVTHISWFDMITWCNALSEMEGKTPVYYSDEAQTKVVRKAFDYNPIKLDGEEFIKIKSKKHPLLKKGYLWGPYATPWIFTRWDVDGYRLPTGAEMDYAIRGGTKTAYHWGNDESKAGEYMWKADNAKGKTQPVGQKKPNPFGLYDIQGNVFELSFSSFKRRDKNRPYELDLDNPIHSPFFSWKLPKKEYSTRNPRGLAGGPCFLFGDFNLNNSHGVGVQSSPDTKANHYYSDVGFRVVRCEADTHPKNGLRPLAKKEIIKYLDVTTASTITSDALYRGDLRRSGVFDKTGVTASPTVKWNVNLGGKIHSSPVVWNGSLFIGGEDAIYCLDAETGAQKWRTPVEGGVDSSACVADGRVLFSSKKGNLLCLDAATGSLKWRYKSSANNVVKSSPAVAYGTVFCALGRETVAVDLQTGKKIWSIKGNMPAEYSSVALSPDALYACGVLNWGYLWSYDPATTEINWRSNGAYVQGAGVYFPKTQALDEKDGIYVNTTRGVRKYSSTDKNGGIPGQHQVLWYTFLLDKDVEDNELIIHSSPTPWNGKVFVGRKDGKFVALSQKDGKIKWKKQFPGECISDPSVAAKSGLVIFGCSDGNVYALNGASGSKKWSFKTGAPVFSSPWIEEGAVYVANENGAVFCLEQKNSK